jgi:peptidyl-prolyl cis-trans isomerase SurA
MNKIHLFIAVLITGLVASSAGRELVDGVVAVVGDSVILRSEVDAFAYLLANQAGAQPDELEMNMLRERALEELIDGKVMMVHAEKDSNITISDRDVSAEVDRRIDMLLAQNNMTPAQLEQTLQQQQGVTLAKFKDQLRSQIRQELIKQGIQQHYISSVINRRDIEAFYEEYKDSLPPAGKSVLLSKIEINIAPSDSIRQDAYSRIKAIKARLEQGENFEDLAKAYSEGPNAAKGGDLGFIAKGTLGELAFEEKAFRTNVGDISEPFETRLGFHIITVTARKDQMVNVKQIFIGVAPSEQHIRQAMARLDSVRNAASSRKQFAQAARAISQDNISRSRDGQMGWKTVLSLDPKIRAAIEDLDEGEITAPIRDNNRITLYRIDQKRDNRMMSLEEDYNQIAQIARRVLTQIKLRDLVKQWRQQTFIDIRS